MKPAIEIKQLSKQYQINKNDRYLSLRENLSSGFKNLFFNKSGGTENFWALKDVSLKIQQGERLGIIGRNGAGKSTLLKILSRVTTPTQGEAVIRGRLASLLEVGTGFHPELTGKENIYLNGAILGLKKIEIDRQFDAIVDFSGVEKFLSTPLKNYSSGMQMRLAFAVAAHLEPEILLIDEVLAVGDIEFQKKCIGKMEEVSRNYGRTILFVSHNLQAINNICNYAVYLNGGKIISYGSTDKVTSEYVRHNQSSDAKEYISQQRRPVFIKHAVLKNSKGEPENKFNMANDIFVETTLEKNTRDTNFIFRIAIHNTSDQRIVLDQQAISCSEKPCNLKCTIKIPSSLLAPNDYSFILALIKPGIGILDNQRNILPFNISKTNTRFEFIDYDYGCLNQPFSWDIQINSDAIN